MMNFCRLSFQTHLNRMLSRTRTGKPLAASLVVGVFATIGLLSGVAPDLSARSPELAFSSSAYALSVSDEEVARFARTAWMIERKRAEVSAQVKRINGGNVPAIGCEPGKVETLPRNIRDIVVDFCNWSTNTIKNNRFSINRFNQILDIYNQKTDRQLYQRIYNEFIRIQR